MQCRKTYPIIPETCDVCADWEIFVDSYRLLHTRIYCVSYYYITGEYLVGINPSAECVFPDWTGRGVCAVLYKRINGYE